MNSARNITRNSIEDISELENGNSRLLSIANNEFKCKNDACDASLTLCSYRSTNIPSPYFKSISQHVDNCSHQYEAHTYDASDLTNRKNGISAFNAVKRRFERRDKEFAIYNPSTRTVGTSSTNKNTNNMSKRKISVGPIIYDGTIRMESGTTYLLNQSDLNFNFGSLTGNWINLPDPNGIGIKIDDECLEVLQNNQNLTLIIYSKYINTSSNTPSQRRYTTTYNMLLIDGRNIVYEK